MGKSTSHGGLPVCDSGVVGDLQAEQSSIYGAGGFIGFLGGSGGVVSETSTVRLAALSWFFAQVHIFKKLMYLLEVVSTGLALAAASPATRTIADFIAI